VTSGGITFINFFPRINRPQCVKSTAKFVSPDTIGEGGGCAPGPSVERPVSDGVASPRPVRTNPDVLDYTQGESDVILFHIYAS